MAQGMCFGQSTWEWKNPLPQGNDLFSLTYDSGQFVAVGDGGMILTSSDGTTWCKYFYDRGIPIDALFFSSWRFLSKDGVQ
jgi:hypothetical protein